MRAVGLLIGVRALVSKKKEEVTPREKLLEKQKTSLNRIDYFAVLGAIIRKYKIQQIISDLAYPVPSVSD